MFPVGEGNKCVLEIRDQVEQRVSIYLLDLEDLSYKTIPINLSWWMRIVGVNGEQLFYIEYLDQKDPNQQTCYAQNFDGSNLCQVKDLPHFKNIIIEPMIYDNESANHHTVSEFLALDLILPCEYLEWEEKIIISYYLRSGNGFDRYLLLIRDGEKQCKVLQDQGMKGFSPGAFFVFRDKLIFVKNKNEICFSNK